LADVPSTELFRDRFVAAPVDFSMLQCGDRTHWAITPVPRIISRRGAGAESTILLHDLSADLANRRVLIAGATAATDRADQLAALTHTILPVEVVVCW
jgi:hypothetical protein